MSEMREFVTDMVNSGATATEAVDYYMTEVVGYTQTAWAEERGVSASSVSNNAGRAAAYVDVPVDGSPDPEDFVYDVGKDVPHVDELWGDIHVALVSGGMDSATSAVIAVEEYGVDLLVYLDTGTGLRENREYVEELADWLGVQMWTLRTNESYEERVLEHGFPGPGIHSIMYRALKERQLGKLRTLVGVDARNLNLCFWTGIRREESRKRMGYAEHVNHDDRWTWTAPICHWTKEQSRSFIESRGVPQNPLWTELGRSGDCFCGCFGSQEEKIDLCAAGCDYHVEWIESLEEQLDCDEPECWWGASDFDIDIDAEDDLGLCSSCGVDHFRAQD